MEDSPVLVSSVEFDEVKRGYDPVQVDNYLQKVGDAVGQLKSMLREAVERAEAADARIAETLRSKALAETAAADAETARVKLEVELADAEQRLANPPVDAESEALKKMLMLAQRTADSAVDEAQASAKNIVADARTKAAEVVADAETRAERLLIEAQKVADELIKEKTGALVLQVRELERRRDDLFADVQSLVDHLKDHRQRLHDAVTHMSLLLDNPIGLRADGLPDMRTLAGESTVADKIAELERDAAELEADARELEREVAPAAAAEVDVDVPTDGGTKVPPAPAVTAPAPVAVSPAPMSAPPAATSVPIDGGGAAPGAAAPSAAAPTASMSAPGSGSGGQSQSSPSASAAGSATALADRPAAAQVNELLEAPRAPRIEIEVVTPEPDVAAFADDDPQIVPVVPLFDQAEHAMEEALNPEPEADEAMRRFFEDDFEGQNQAKGIFRRK